MRFEWDNEKIELYVRASKETGFHKKIAEQISSVLNKHDELTDVGCGPGIIDFELSQHVKSINAIDIEPEVIEYLQSEIKENKITNIFPVIADAALLDKSLGDVVLTCFFSGNEEAVVALIDASSRLSIIVTHGEGSKTKPSKISGNKRKTSASDIERTLLDGDYDYKRKDLTLDFGQPLKTEEEALEFLEMYCTEDDPVLRKCKIEEGFSNLKPSCNPVYPYAIPNIKEVAIFIITK